VSVHFSDIEFIPEFAALMLIEQVPDYTNLSTADLDALLSRQLITRETLAPGSQRIRLTRDGQMILHTLARIS